MSSLVQSTEHPSIVYTYILAGGRSSRFGSDKARELINGTPQIVNLYQRFSEQRQSQAFVVAGSKEAYIDLKLPTIADATPNLGPVSGVVTALEHFSTCVPKRRQYSAPLAIPSSVVGERPSEFEYLAKWCLIVACDLWEWHPVWVSRLVAAVSSTDSPSSSDCRAACFFESAVSGDNPKAGRWTPFPGLFQASALEFAKQIRDSSRASMQDLLNLPEMSSAAVSLGGIPEVRSANTREDLDNLKKLASIQWTPSKSFKPD